VRPATAGVRDTVLRVVSSPPANVRPATKSAMNRFFSLAGGPSRQETGMAAVTVKSFTELHKALEQYRAVKSWVFRGHADAQWPLLSKAGRAPYKQVSDEKVFASWKRRAVEYVPIRPQSDFDWLAVAQHHGLATRLLDWTKNPLVAAYFAVREQRPGDAVIYAASFKKQLDSQAKEPKTGKPVDPMTYKGVALFYPTGVVPRITRQGGLFSVHGVPNAQLQLPSQHLLDLRRINIAESYRQTLLSELSFYGINSVNLFPDLDGLSSFLNWTMETKEYWNVIAEPAE
jgi:hypothetical protein